jgi:hypothetical protein
MKPFNVDYLIFDFWTERVYGPMREFPVFLAPFSCHVLFVQPMPSQPALLGSTRHVGGFLVSNASMLHIPASVSSFINVWTSGRLVVKRHRRLLF